MGVGVLFQAEDFACAEVIGSDDGGAGAAGWVKDSGGIVDEHGKEMLDNIKGFLGTMNLLSPGSGVG